ncbi:N-methyl-L-tryptophan oxidase [Saccharopolyspora sp. 5N708]|uniref:N-methyl-L-tryptophan oxidase n=1 Tax=Saccharopolyspora sp. 5N708 TaxID=3457424 RepID=UPI003FD2D36F
MSYDVIVVGLGGMGSAAAHRLAARGQRVLGIEQFHAAHDLGSSHGNSRITRLAYSEHPSYVPLMRRSYELWREVERESGRRLLTMTGAVMLGDPDSSVVSGALLSAQQWGLPHEVLEPAEVRRRFPTLHPRDDELAVVEDSAGFVRPEQAVLAHSDLATRAGARLHYGERVIDWTTTASSAQLTTDRGTYVADRLVFCPGAWAPELLADLGIPLVVERQVMHWFQPRGGVDRFEDHPVYLWEADPEHIVYGFPAQDGEECVKVAFYRRPGITTPDSIDRTVHPAEVEEIAAYLADRIPGLAGHHLRSKACMYTLTPDHHFVIGPHPGHPRVVVACGFSGHGFKFVPLVGEVLADLVVDGATSHDIALFDPTRAFTTP